MDWFARTFELSRGDGGNVRSMEGLRGFAVLLVFLVHFLTLGGKWYTDSLGLTAVIDSVRMIGNAGVDLFFVLSGYLIYGSLMQRAHPFGKFMSRRIVRIYPAFLVVLALYVLLSVAFPRESKIPDGASAAAWYVLKNLLLLPGVFPIEPIITVAWSLSYEMLYYLVVPLLIGAFSLRARTSAWRVLFFSAIGAALFIWGVYGGLVRLAMFIAGILLFEAMKRDGLRLPGWVAVTLLAAAFLVQLPPIETGGTSIKIGALFVAFFALCLACFKSDSGWLASAFKWTPMRWLGNMSYSYYLLHGLALKAFFVLLPLVFRADYLPPSTLPVLLVVAFAATLVPSVALFVLVEKPLSLSGTTGGALLKPAEA